MIRKNLPNIFCCNRNYDPFYEIRAWYNEFEHSFLKISISRTNGIKTNASYAQMTAASVTFRITFITLTSSSHDR